jgi:UDP-N-acetylglucosamine 4,6-dehydratase
MQGGEVFVPKLPSMRVTDLADVIAPHCRRVVTGIRPGEKLHEVLLSEDETRNTISYNGMYVVVPTNRGDDGVQGMPLPDNFTYRSDKNAWWLTKTDLQNLLDRELAVEQPSSKVAAMR